MVTGKKPEDTGIKGKTKERIKLDKLKLNKETLKDLGAAASRQIRGGVVGSKNCLSHHPTPPGC